MLVLMAGMEMSEGGKKLPEWVVLKLVKTGFCCS